MIRYSLFGKHSHRTPLSYYVFRKYFRNYLFKEVEIKKAEVIILGFVKDIKDNFDVLYQYVTENEAVLVVLSEEPLWDTLWSGEYSTINQTVVDKDRILPFKFFNHFTTSVFNFSKIPYFITTDNKFILRYENHLSDVLNSTYKKMESSLKERQFRYSFIVEKRVEKYYEFRNKELDTYGLSCFRSQLANELVESSLVVGKGWFDSKPRQSLVDWHLDKLATISGQSFFVGSLENTHQSAYVSEKIFDAYSVASIPIYFASDNHRIHDLLPNSSFVNLYGLDIPESIETLRDFCFGLETFERYMADVENLYSLFSDNTNLENERLRIVNEIESLFLAI